MRYYPAGYNAIGAAPLPKGVGRPSISARGLTVGAWLEAKRQAWWSGGYGARKDKQLKAKARREAQMTMAMRASTRAATRRAKEGQIGIRRKLMAALGWKR